MKTEEEIKKELEEKLDCLDEGVSGYVEALEWVLEG